MNVMIDLNANLIGFYLGFGPERSIRATFLAMIYYIHSVNDINHKLSGYTCTG